MILSSSAADCAGRSGPDRPPPGGDAARTSPIPAPAAAAGRHGGVAILMGTHEGQRYLTAQLESFAGQTYSCWQVWVSDDGSKDLTRPLLEKYRDRWDAGRLHVVEGPRKGFVANFLSLACNENIVSDYFAFSDQDDIWDASKLERAVHWLSTVPPDVPALYCSRARLVDADDRDIGRSALARKGPDFANALVQNIASGNTMVFNEAARRLLCLAGKDIAVAAHDWWLYIAVTACGGRVHYDPVPSLRYRQHPGNLIGSGVGAFARWGRLRGHWHGRLRRWTDANLEALRLLDDRLTPANRDVLARFADARRRWLLPRLIGYRRAGIHRQTPLGNAALIAAAVLGKV